MIKKEVLTKILDFRFLISSMIGLCLIVLTTVILSGQYVKQRDQYDEFVNSDRGALNDVKAFSELRLNAHRPPTPLSIFNKGLSNQVDNTMRIRHPWVPRQGLETRSENPFMSIFEFFDLTTVFQIVLSLLAILLVYDAVSGEREEGTLKAILSNSVARYQILASKFASSMIGLALSLLISLIISFLIMMLGFGITFNLHQWTRIGLMLLATFIFLGFFVSAGLLVSSLVKQSSITLIWLLFLWVVSVIIQPNIGTYLSSIVVSIPPRERIESAEDQVWQELEKERQRIEQEVQEEVPGDPWHSDQGGGWPYYYCYEGNRVGLYRYVLRTQRIQPLIVDQAEKEWRIYQGEYHAHLNRQLSYQTLFDKLSPAAIYHRITASIAQTAIQDHEDFIDQARQYRRSYLSYLMDERKVFSENANLYFTQQTMEQIRNSDFDERRRKQREGVEGIVFYSRDYFGPLDLTGLPQFRFQPMSLSRSILNILPDAAIRVCLTVVMFFLCSIAFNRYDVRSN